MRRFVNALLLVQLLACTGTDVGNPPRGGLSSFDTPGCKSVASPDKGVDPSRYDWLPDDERHRGLQCFLWDRQDDGKLRVRVTNYTDGCHADEGWHPRAIARGEREVDLVLENPGCVSASCGWCLYELLFVLDAKLTVQSTLSLNLLRDPDCSDQRRESVTLPLGEHASGVTCRYANPYALNDWTFTHPASAGQERMPCGHSEPGASCAAGLTCTAVDSGGRYQDHKLCLASCQSDSDCESSELMHCREGTCQLAAPR
ncbi:MAG TPA: hypothetical protein VMF89_26750 [Polyangiales bacterium]|nr:hypothetical protein [Polyangiales bacterium]